ncbi:CcdB family protein [Poseidonibacter antarcticus]|uniref:CcdB family protein n=1 Tax=Poseidonibacter antarcticus TaxID=2478538 RepID=UPI000EF51CA2|nr:CcdB family protein [Poseidonibacter antarcticus]
MAQFDVYKNENERTNKEVPYLLDIQNDILSSLDTRVVIPLVFSLAKVDKLTKELKIKDEIVYLYTDQMATIGLSLLNEKICSIKEQGDEIKNSIDFLIYGF